MDEADGPPQMAGWNLALRFGLELVGLVGLGVAAWNSTTGLARWVAAVGVPVGAAAAWGVFNVVDDPSRSGKAPVQVPGWIRLAIEFVILGAGAVALGGAFGQAVGVGFLAIVIGHYVASASRVRWLLSQ